jgi:FtsZ-binding cell division protein ZapB
MYGENDILRRNIQQMKKQNSKLGKRNAYLQIKNDDFQRHNQSLVQDIANIFSDMKGLHSINQQMGSDLATIQQEMNSIVQKYATRLVPKDTGAATEKENTDFDSMDVV